MSQRERDVIHGRLAALMGVVPTGALVMDEDPRLKKPEPEKCPCCGRAIKKEKKHG